MAMRGGIGVGAEQHGAECADEKGRETRMHTHGNPKLDELMWISVSRVPCRE
jgi:hypothetical protein